MALLPSVNSVPDSLRKTHWCFGHLRPWNDQNEPLSGAENWGSQFSYALGLCWVRLGLPILCLRPIPAAARSVSLLPQKRPNLLRNPFASVTSCASVRRWVISQPLRLVISDLKTLCFTVIFCVTQNTPLKVSSTSSVLPSLAEYSRQIERQAALPVPSLRGRLRYWEDFLTSATLCQVLCLCRQNTGLPRVKLNK